jgi:drug/metabolite transporter (DMT)-like permease
LLGPILKNPVRVSRYIFSPRIVAIASLAITAFFLFDFGVTSGGASIPIVSSLAGMAGAVEAGYATVLLREKLERNQALGIILLLVGVFSLLYFR